MSRQPSRPLAAALAVLLAAAACRTPAEHAAEADRDVLALVESRRARLALQGDPFTIVPQPDSLRQRLLRGEADEIGPLDLVRCLEIAAENSRDYQRRKETLYLAALDLTLERWRYSWIEAAAVEGAVAGTGDEAQSASAAGDLGLTKLLGTGAVIVADLGLSLARSLTISDDWDPIGDLSLSITQPLLRGFGSEIALEPLTQAERDLVYAVRDYERFRRTFAVDVATRYYGLLESLDAIANQERDVESKADLTQRNLALAEAGRLPDIDVGQARQDELTSRNELIRAQADHSTRLDAFKLFLGLPIDIELELDPAGLAKLVEAGVDELDLAEDAVVGIALERRLDFQNTRGQLEDAERGVRIAADALRAGLTLQGGAALASEPGKPLEYDLSETAWSFSAFLDLPLDRTPERNAYRASLIDLERARRAVEESSDTIQVALREELREVQSQLEGYRIRGNAVDLALRRIESTRLKLDAGRADTRDLLEAQEALLDNRNSLTSALVDYTLSRLFLWRDMELISVDAEGVHLEPLPAAAADPARGEP